MIEDVRQVFQDFLAPELRALAIKMDGIDKRLDVFEKSVEIRISNQDKLAEARHSEILANFESLRESLAIHKRLERLESKQDKPAA